MNMSELSKSTKYRAKITKYKFVVISFRAINKGNKKQNIVYTYRVWGLTFRRNKAENATEKELRR